MSIGAQFGQYTHIIQNKIMKIQWGCEPPNPTPGYATDCI